MNKKLLIILLVILLAIVLGATFILPKLGINSLTSQYRNAQLDGLEVLEIVDFNTNPVRFKLNVQSHGEFSPVPHKLVLREKSTNELLFELPLVASENVHECASHEQMMEDMKKWNTDWFTIEELGEIDNEYETKLADKYIADVIYEDGGKSNYLSKNAINGVCYHASKSTPLMPTDEDQLPED